MPIFKCSYCYFECSPLVKDIVKHYDTWHPDKKVFPCETCGKLFARKFVLERHIKEAHTKIEEDQLQCSHCQYSTNRKADLIKHVESRHNKPNFSCSILTLNFAPKVGYKMQKTLKIGVQL